MLDRRDFARLSLGAAASLAVASPRTRVIKPKQLVAGDTLGLVLPASAEIEADAIAFARDQLIAAGFNVVLGAHVYDRWGYLAGRDRDRAGDVNRMFADDKVAGSVCHPRRWAAPRL